MVIVAHLSLLMIIFDTAQLDNRERKEGRKNAGLCKKKEQSNKVQTVSAVPQIETFPLARIYGCFCFFSSF